MDATLDFYTQALGMRLVTFGEGRKALQFGNQKINLHQAGHEFEPKADKPTTGSADLCFVIQCSLEEATEHLSLLDIAITEGPVERAGAVGKLTSLYVRDPDLNLLELAVYSAVYS